MPKALRSSTPILQGWVATETQHHPPIIRLFVTWYGSIGGHKSTKSLSGKRFN